MTDRKSLEWNSPLPRAEKGLGVPYMSYGSGRLGATVTPWGGLHQIAYYGIAPESSPAILFQAAASTSYDRLFRLQIRVDGLLYNQELNETDHYPFGYRSVFEIPRTEVKVSHHLTLLNDALISTVEVLQNPDHCSLVLELEHHCSTQLEHTGKVLRTWSSWSSDKEIDALTIGAHDCWSEAGWQQNLQNMIHVPGEVGFATRTAGVRESTAHIALFSDRSLSVSGSCGRMQISSQPFETGTKAIALLFASNRAQLEERFYEIRSNNFEEALKKEIAYRERIKTTPSLTLANPILSSYFTHAPGISETLVVEDVPGAMRAAAMHYWVWGWDTVMCADAFLASGNTDFARDALRFYHSTSDGGNEWGHQFSRELKIRIPQAPSAQCLYLIMLLSYFAYTNDKDLIDELFPFARQIFLSAIKSINRHGLGTGPALWPDLPIFAGHTGDDCSVFNNSILYQGARSIETLAQIYGDNETAMLSRKLTKHLETKFVETFWDDSKIYFTDSVDSETLERRKSYPSHAVLWQSAYCDDLVHDKLVDCAKFIAENHATNRGFLPYPRWDKAFNGDCNQLGQTWPITDVFDTMCLAAAGDQSTLTQWLEGLEWFWSQLTVPEAYSSQTVNDSGTPDAPGGKQPFSAKSWYMALIQSVAGVTIDIGGITIGPGLDRSLRLSDLFFRGSRVTVICHGAGRYPATIEVNGVAVVGSCKVPLGLIVSPNGLHQKPRIDILRTNAVPPYPVILSLNGGEIQEVTASVADGLSADIAAHHDVWLRFSSPDEPIVTLNGQPITSHYDPGTHEGKSLLPVRQNCRAYLEIRRIL